MEKVISVITSGKASLSKGRHDDDFADRLSSKYSPLLLIVFTIVVTIQQLVRNPITCWTPAHFTSSHEKYSNNFCWVRSTYYLPFPDEIPRVGEDKQMLTYYQWIQFIFLAQACCFFIPTMVWRTFNSKSGVDADSILQASHRIPQVNNAEKKEEMVGFLAGQLDRFLNSRKPTDTCQCDFKHILSGCLCRCCGRRIGNYLVLLYMFQKILFIANIILQFCALNALLGDKFYLYGAEVLRDPIPNHDWNSAHFVAFPRVTMCDVEVRRLGNIQRYTLQCVLPLNLYIEKIYVFLWFWMVFVLFMSICSFFMWLIRFIFRKDRLNFVKNHLYRTHQLDTEDDLQLVDRFLDDYLRQDGAFLLRLVATNTNQVSSGVIIQGVWEYWREKIGNPVQKPAEEPAPGTEKARLLEEEEGVPDKTNNPGLKHRKPNIAGPGDDDPKDKPRKSDLSRAPTMYIRGNDTMGPKRPDSDLYPKVNEIDKTKLADEKPDSDDSGQGLDNTPPLTKPSAPPANDHDSDSISSNESEPDVKISPDSEQPSPTESSDPQDDTSKPPPLYPDLETGTVPVPKPRKSHTAPGGDNISPEDRSPDPQSDTPQPTPVTSDEPKPVTSDEPNRPVTSDKQPQRTPDDQGASDNQSSV